MKVPIEEFKHQVGLASDCLPDHRDIDALEGTAAAILLRDRLSLSGKLGKLGPIQLAQVCDYIGQRLGGDRETGAKVIETVCEMVTAFPDDMPRTERAIKRLIKLDKNHVLQKPAGKVPRFLMPD